METRKEQIKTRWKKLSRDIDELIPAFFMNRQRYLMLKTELAELEPKLAELTDLEVEELEAELMEQQE